MAFTYNIEIGIKITRSHEGETMTDDKYYFENQTFPQMANKSDKIFEIITALQKSK